MFFEGSGVNSEIVDECFLVFLKFINLPKFLKKFFAKMLVKTLKFIYNLIFLIFKIRFIMLRF